MYQVEGEYPDYQKTSNKSKFFLNADQSFDPYRWKAPINWEGYVGGQKVKITQIESHALFEDCFDWQDFPVELSLAKSSIIKAIDVAMKKSMD